MSRCFKGSIAAIMCSCKEACVLTKPVEPQIYGLIYNIDILNLTYIFKLIPEPYREENLVFWFCDHVRL